MSEKNKNGNDIHDGRSNSSNSELYQITREIYIRLINNDSIIDEYNVKHVIHKSKEAAKLFIKNYDNIENDSDVTNYHLGV